MRRSLLLGALLTIAVLGLGAVLVGRGLVDDGALARRLAAAAAERIGVSIEVRGPIHLRLLPRPRLVLHDVEAAGRLVVDRIDVDLAPLPLLIGRAEAEAVRLVRPSLGIAAADLAGARLADAAASAAPWPGRIEIEDGRLAVADAGLAVTGLAGAVAPDGFRFVGAGLDGTLVLQGRLGGSMKDGRRPVEAALLLARDGETALLDWRGTLGPEGALKGRLGFGAQDPALLPGLDGWTGETALETGLDWSGGRLRLDEAVLTLGGQVLKGGLDLDTEGKRLDLALEGGDLALAAHRLPWLLARIGPLGAYAGEVALAAERLRLDGLVLERPRLRAALAGDGGVILREARAGLPDGGAVLEGVLRLGGTPAFEGTVALSGLDLAAVRPLLPDLPARLLAPYARAALDGRITAKPGAWALDDARLDLDGARFSGRLAQSGVTLDVRGRLDQLALDDWPRPDALEGIGADARLRLDLAVDRAAVAALDAQAVRLEGEAAAGRFDLARLAGETDGGRFELKGRFEGGRIEGGLDLALDAPARFLRHAGIDPPAPLALLGPLTARLDTEGGGADGLAIDGWIEGEGYRATLDGRHVDPSAGTGRLAVTLANAGRGGGLWRLLPGGLPTALTEAPTRLALDVAAKAGGAVVTGLKGRLGDVDLEGSLSRGDGAGTEASLAAKGVNAALLGAVYDRMQPPLGLIPRPFSAVPGRLPTARLDWGWLMGAPWRLRLDLEPALKAEAKREAGALVVRLEGLDLGGGRLSGRLGLDGAAAALDADFDLKGADLEEVLALLGIRASRSGGSGALDLAASLKATGQSPADLARTLEGEGRLALDGARLPRLDEVGGAAWGRGVGLKGGFAVKEGIVRSEPDGLRVAGGGEAGRVDALLDLYVWLLEATVRPDAKAAPVLRAVGPPGALDSRLVRPLDLGGRDTLDALSLPGAVATPRGPASSPAGPIP